MWPYGSFPQKRLRRNRISPSIRNLVLETHLSAKNLIYPIFVRDNMCTKNITNMPGIYRMSIEQAAQEALEAKSLGIGVIALFPYVDAPSKSIDGKEAYNENGLIPRAIKAIKDKVSNISIMADVALDPYTSHGHDGILTKDGYVSNDETIYALCKQALVNAKAGADILAPSDMMDGRIGIIRKALDDGNYNNVLIMAYSAKYASSYYGPFRYAVGSNTESGSIDKSSYQMNPANSEEALHEVAQDLSEGADIILIKPGMPYLDVIHMVKQTFKVPICAYQVSGEYVMHKQLACLNKSLEKDIVLESLICLRRAGANCIVTYFAKQAAKWLQN